jgi:hypothetical protein
MPEVRLQRLLDCPSCLPWRHSRFLALFRCNSDGEMTVADMMILLWMAILMLAVLTIRLERRLDKAEKKLKAGEAHSGLGTH